MYPHFAVIALGSNLANPAEQVRAALAELTRIRISGSKRLLPCI